MVKKFPFYLQLSFSFIPQLIARFRFHGILYLSRHLSRVVFTAFIILIISGYHPAFAVRPFITDDARTTPKHTFLTEGSLRFDENRFQNLMLFALGITDALEGTIGFTDGFLRHGEEGRYSLAGPLLQIKYLFTDQKGYIPAIGAAIGVAPPWGAGNKDFAPLNWSEFGYLMVSRSFCSHPERLNLHLNIGGTITHESSRRITNDIPMASLKSLSL